jgi:hypothetical protein
MVKICLAVFLLFVAYAACDLYMHNPRGSNDRLNEANTNRNNGNRLFDSQNNAKGGYCIGPQMTYYEGSLLSIEWTNQHGCGSNPKMICNLVVQYMCGSTNDDILHLIRDGTSTDTIPNNAAGAATIDTTVTPNAPKYGMHESYQSYQDCNTRNRNMGLYIADRAAQGGLTTARASAIYTRQNNNGAQNGFECPEERDYYPYWSPSQWKDVAILTTNKNFCKFYQQNSQNTVSKGFCQASSAPGIQTAQNNPTDCTAQANQWVQQPAWGLSAPVCDFVPWSRENHLGNGVDGFPNTYNWTLPQGVESCVSSDTCTCVVRLRYNVSTIEDGWPLMSNPDQGFIDYNQNGNNTIIKQNPTIPLSYNMGNGTGTEVTLAVDTSQYGRTFQDRSHTFKLSARPSGIPKNSRLYNLNVRGKRGNIVQTYPATEYDFVPQYLYTRVGDYIHFQWTGCDTNPAGNAGEGTDQTDRSNLVQLSNPSNSLPITDAWVANNPKKVFIENSSTRLNFVTLGQQNCMTATAITAAGGNAETDPRNCGKLNAPGANYFNGGILKMNKTGTFYYMNTRNHNFTNRDQKGIIYVVPLLPPWAVGVVVTGAVLFGIAAACAGLMFYAKSHPHSGVANLFSKI